MKKDNHITVFISGPQDIKREKEIIKNVCTDLSDILIRRRKLWIRPIFWEDNIPYEITDKGAQQQINEFLNEINYEIYIGLMWKYYGEKQQNGYSPTEEEFLDALSKYKERKLPRIKFLFKQTGKKKNPKVFAEVDRFRERVYKYGLADSFSTKVIFQKKIYNFLVDVVDNYLYIPNINKFEDSESKVEEDYFQRKTVDYKTYQTAGYNYILNETLEELTEVIKTKSRIVLLGDAGLGKSRELEHALYYYSKNDSPFYPILIKLNKYSSNQLTELFPDDWEQLPKNQLLLLFDGFDEVESNFRRNIIRQIELFSDKYPESRMVISSRNNFYNIKDETNGQLETLHGFESYILTRLDYEQINKYVNEKVQKHNTEFWNSISINKIYDLLSIPYYLYNLTDLFNSGNELPKNRGEIYESIIRSKIQFDKEHFKNKFDDYQTEIIYSHLEKLALVMEILGRNHISSDEYKKIIPDTETRFHKTVFTKKGNYWEFDHNSIQEYLAAKYLCKFDLDLIKSLVFFKPDYKKIIPSWTNTLSFLLNIYPNDSIKDLILTNEPELTIQFEQDRISEDQRVLIFRSIFNHARNKQIWLDRNKFRYLELARFAQSEEAIKFLLQFIDLRRHYTTIGNAINLIGNMSIAPHLEDQVKSKLLKIATSFNYPAIQNDAILALASLKYFSKKLIDKLIKHIGNSDNDWIRYGLYSIINKANKQNEYVSVYLDGLKYTREKFESSNTGKGRLINESLELNEGLSKVTEVDSVRSIISYFIKNTSDLNIIGFDRITKQLWLNAAIAYEKDNTILDLIIHLLFQIRKHYLREEATRLRIFFETSKTYNDAFLCTYKQNKLSDDFPYKWSFFVAPECFELIYNKYKNSELSDDNIWTLINSLNHEGNPFLDEFSNFINKKTNNKFKPQLFTRNFDKERKETKERELRLLFDRDALFKEIEIIFKLERKTKLSKSEIDEIKKHSWEHNKYLNSVLSILNNQTEVEPTTISKSKKKIGIKSWNYWSINEIYNLMHHDSNYKPAENHIACVNKMCDSWVKKIDFNEAIKQKGQTYTTNDRAILSSYFLKNFNFKYPQKVLLDLVSYDWDNTGILYLINFLTVDQIKSRILFNISHRELNDREIRNYLEFSKHYNIEEVKNFAIIVLLDTTKDHELRELALEINNSLKTIEGILSKFIKTDSFKWDVIDWLIEKNSDNIENYLLKELNDGKSAHKVKSALRLVQIGNIEGLKYYTSHLESCKRFILDRYGNNPFKNLSNIKAIPYLLKLLKLSYSDELKQDRYDTLYNTVISALTQIALTNEDNYILIRKELLAFIEKYKSLIKNVTFLYSHIDSLEQQFYFNKSEKYTINEVLEILNQIEA